MKIINSQVSPSYSGVTSFGASNQLQIQAVAHSQAVKPEKVLEVSDNGNDTENKAKSETEPDEKQLIDAIEKTNKAIEGSTCSFEYSIHEQTKQIMVKVIDNETKEVIREFPPEKILDMVAKMWEVAGIMVDERR